MSTHKHIDLICVVVLVCTLAITILFVNGKSFGLEPIVDGDAQSSSDSAFFTRNDRDGEWDPAGATHITLSGSHATVSGGGAYVYDGDVVIAQAGRYVLSGTLDNGSVIVNADKNAKVWLLLDGAEISCEDNACLRVEQADKVFLTLAAGTENRLTSGAAYSEEALADNIGGVIFSRDDLTINGSGSLIVTGAYKHGIDVNDELVITGGSLTIEAAQDGIHTNDGFSIEQASLTIKAGDEGVYLQGEDAVAYIASGSLSIESVGAGIKCEADLLMESGSATISTEADGIHVGGSVNITDGELTISVGDDGIHADSAITITGGHITIPTCYEGIEALTIDISGGEIEIYPTDDGLNANGGGFGPGPGMFMQRVNSSDESEDSETWIHISGGSITVVNADARDADGLDSNGDIVISGGVIRVSLTASGSNNAIDYGSESGGICQITGGELVACGSAAMAEGFSDTSTQCAVLYNLGYTAEAGTELRVMDASGRVILSYTAPCSFSSVSLSSPEMQLGETYTIAIDDREEQITLESVSTTAGSASGMGGGMGWGQMRQNGGGRGGRQSGGEGWNRGSMQGSPNGAAPDMSGMQTPPDMGDMPTPPEFGEGGPDFSDMPAPPDMGEMPTLPDMGEMQTPPDMGEMGPGFERDSDGTGNAQQSGGGMRRGEMPDPVQSAEPESTETSDETATGPQPVSAGTWGMVAFSAAALLLGLLFAIKYRQR